MNVESLVEAICHWCGETAEHEAALLNPYVEWKVNATDLLDLIHNETAIDKQRLGEWVEQGRTG